MIYLGGGSRTPKRVLRDSSELDKMQRTADCRVPSPNWYIYNITPKAQKHCGREGGEKIVRARRPGQRLQDNLLKTGMKNKNQEDTKCVRWGRWCI